MYWKVFGALSFQTYNVLRSLNRDNCFIVKSTSLRHKKGWEASTHIESRRFCSTSHKIKIVKDFMKVLRNTLFHSYALINGANRHSAITFLATPMRHRIVKAREIELDSVVWLSFGQVLTARPDVLQVKFRKAKFINKPTRKLVSWLLTRHHMVFLESSLCLHKPTKSCHF